MTIQENYMAIKNISYLRRNLWSGFIFGIGLAAFVDETLFHQLLHWHHFYDKSTTDIGLISDGLFHAFSWFATVGGLFIVADLRRRSILSMKRWWGGVLLGGGLFQLYDGTIQHKLMRLHQIRYVDNVVIYDLVWNALAIAMVAVGLVLVNRSGKENMGDGRTVLNDPSRI
jgi:uncharacterized membrane protein